MSEVFDFAMIRHCDAITTHGNKPLNNLARTLSHSPILPYISSPSYVQDGTDKDEVFRYIAFAKMSVMKSILLQ
jgi:hypothetical protein